ncbi:MAG: aminopeptidase P family protein [Firmicutes bacterium]|nr:aminopeptidase P family protein [Bacillota bacterium]
MMNKRISKLKEELSNKNIDSCLIFKPENRRYISNFTGTTGYVLITEKRNIFATDFRYTQQAKEQCSEFEVKELTKDYTIFNLLNELEIENLGIEEDFVTYGFVNELKEKSTDINIMTLNSLLTKIRMIKEEEEVKLIKEAALITDKAFEHIISYIKPGMKENKISIELEHFMKKLGAEGPSFNFIVASGKRSSMPHGVASDKVIEDGDFVTIDMGCKYKGYCSDMTRTFVMGKASDKQKKIYNTVLKAQIKALENVKPGITGFDLDKIARDVIKKEGYGEYFGHGLGHGVGLEIHELPRLAEHNSAKIEMEAGMVITDEPGIYIPGFGGVRIEDLAVVTKDGVKILSESTKELLEINN